MYSQRLCESKLAELLIIYNQNRPTGLKLTEPHKQNL